MTRATTIRSAQSLGYYTTPPHECSYLSGHRAVTLFVDPYMRMDNAIYSQLADTGFRRSGSYVYRPRCPSCLACVPVRIPVADFRPDRSQRRAWARNQGIEVHIKSAAFDEEHFALYRRYTRQRHPGGGMDTDEPEQYRGFLISPWADTQFVEFRENGRLMSVSVIDCMAQGLSAVYTFFEPEVPRRGLGVYTILWQIEEARRRGLPWVYLGYWIAETQKMAYKTRYRPLEAYLNGQWLPLSDHDFAASPPPR